MLSCESRLEKQLRKAASHFKQCDYFKSLCCYRKVSHQKHTEHVIIKIRRISDLKESQNSKYLALFFSNEDQFYFVEVFDFWEVLQNSFFFASGKDNPFVHFQNFVFPLIKW